MPKGGVFPDADLSGDLCLDFTTLIDKYSEMVYRLCFVNMRNKFDAEDAYQEVFLKLHKKLHDKDDEDGFVSDEHVKAWLLRITINQCKNMCSRAYRRMDVPLDERTACSKIKNNDNTVADYILDLPDKYRQVIYLFYYEEYSTEEIAEIMKIKPGAVRTNLTRARNMIKKRLEKRGRKGGNIDEG